MQNVTHTEQYSRRTGRKKKWRLSQKGKFRLFFIALLLVLFGVSYSIASWVFLSAPVAAELPETEPDTETPEKVKVSAPEPVTDPKLPTILTGLTVTENNEPMVEEPEGEPEGETTTEEEPPEAELEGEPSTEEEPAEEETPSSESRQEGLR